MAAARLRAGADGARLAQLRQAADRVAVLAGEAPSAAAARLLHSLAEAQRGDAARLRAQAEALPTDERAVLRDLLRPLRDAAVALTAQRNAVEKRLAELEGRWERAGFFSRLFGGHLKRQIEETRVELARLRDGANDALSREREAEQVPVTVATARKTARDNRAQAEALRVQAGKAVNAAAALDRLASTLPSDPTATALVLSGRVRSAVARIAPPTAPRPAPAPPPRPVTDYEPSRPRL